MSSFRHPQAASQLVDADSGGHGGIQRLHTAGNGYLYPKIALRANQLPGAGALAPDHNDSSLNIRKFLKLLGSFWIQANDPVPNLLGLGERPGQIHHPGNREVGTGTGRGPGRGRADSSRPVLRKDQPPCPQDLGRPDDRAQILGIGHPVEGHQERWGTLEQLGQGRVAERPGPGGDPLVIPSTGQPIERRNVGQLDGNPQTPRRREKRLDRARPGHRHQGLERIGLRTQEFPHRIDPEDEISRRFRRARPTAGMTSRHRLQSRPDFYSMWCFGMGPTLRRYFLREVVTPFLFGIAVFTFILLTARMLKLVELVVNRGVPLSQIIKVFGYILPTFLEMTVPMGLLLAVLLSFGRMSADSEIVALKTSGISLYQMMVPVMLFTIVVYVLSFLVAAYARPWGNVGLKTSLYEIAKTRASAGLQERVFNDDFAGLVIYVEHVHPPGDQLSGILIADSRDPDQRNTVTAKHGVLVGDESTHHVTLRLNDGNIHTFVQGEQSYQKTDFTVYDVTLDLAVALAKFSSSEKTPKEMTLGELRSAIATKRTAGANANELLVEFHRKFALPFACLVFGLIAVPLGLQPVRAVRSRGFSVSLGLLFVYYLLLTAGETMAEKGTVPPIVGLWMPNAFFTLLGLALFQAAAREKPWAISASIGNRLALRRASNS